VLGYWPGWEGHDGWLDLASTAFAVLVVLPALVVMALDLRRGAAGDDGLVMRRLAGALVAGAFLGMYVFIGDPRLRVPFDPLLVVLALVALRRALPALARARARWEARRAARA
jgi:cation transport ATPase